MTGYGSRQTKRKMETDMLSMGVDPTLGQEMNVAAGSRNSSWERNVNHRTLSPTSASRLKTKNNSEPISLY